MKIFYCMFLLLAGTYAHGQAPVSVFGYPYFDQSVTQSDIDNAGSVFSQQSVTFPTIETFSFSGSSEKEIHATSFIKIEGGTLGFKAGPYSGNGKMKLTVAPSPFDVAVMNYNGLDHILRYEKLELGVVLPSDIATKVNYFLNSTEGEKLNPFLDWELRVVAEFRHVPSGFTKSVDAFYYRNMQRDVANNTWTDGGTAHPFRVRYSPPSTGIWQCFIRIITNGVETNRSATFTFKVENSNNDGYVSIHSNGKQFVRNGEIIYPVGTNLPFPGGGVLTTLDTYNVENGNYLEEYPLYAWTDYLNKISEYGDQGGKYIRIINSPTSGEVEFEKLGNYYDRLKFASEMDKLLEICHEKGILIDFNLMLHTPIMKGADYYQFTWDYGNYWPQSFIENGWLNNNEPYCYSSAFSSSLPSDMVMNETTLVNGHYALEYIKQRYRYYISRYGYSTDVYMFELLSEPWHMDENIFENYHPYDNDNDDNMNDGIDAGSRSRQAVEKFHTELSDYIKINLQHNEHLIGAIGHLTAHSVFPNENSPKPINDNSWGAQNIDVICLSNYSVLPNAMIISKSDGGNNGFDSQENSTAHWIHYKVETYNKPAHLSETGWGDNSSTCSDFKGHKIGAMQKGYIGLAGFNMWEGWTYPDIYNPNAFDQSVLWSPVVLAQNHLNNDYHKSVFASNWVQGRQKLNNGKKEHQYVLSEDKELGVGYVYNRTYNALTLNNNPSDSTTKCTQCHDGVANDGNPEFDFQFWSFENMNSEDYPLVVEGLKQNKHYKIYWYNYSNSLVLIEHRYTGLFSTNIELEHPDLNAYVASGDPSPLMWYQIELDETNRSVSETEITQTNNSMDTRKSEKWGINELTVSPNPTKGLVRVRSYDCKVYNYTITDYTGRKFQYSLDGSNDFTIDLTDFAQGIYFLEINDSGVLYKIAKYE